MADSPWLSIDLKSKGGKLVFKDIQELQTWMETEIAVWSWLDSYVNSDGNLQSAISNGQFTMRNQLRSYVQQYPQNPGLLSEINNYFTNNIASGRFILSATPAGKLILKKKENDPMAAAWSLAALTGTGLNLNSVTGSALDGILEAALFRLGIRGTALSEKEALDQAFGQVTVALAEARANIDAAKAEATRLAEEFQNTQKDFRDDIKNTLQKAGEDFAAEVKQGEDQLQAIAKTYDDKLALQAPVTYWETKQKKHLTAIRWLIPITVLVMVLSVLGIVAAIHYLLPTVTPGSFPEPWKLGLILIVVTMVIWITRLLIKVLLSHVHLHTDAQERRILTNTYLSLIRSNETLNDENRTLILQILFRPAATGIVDDGGPATPMEFFGKLASGGGKH